MKRESGFTVIEAIVAVVVLIIIGVFFLMQRSDLLSAARDQERKTDINAIYLNLKNIYFADNSYYPTSVNNEILRGIDISAFIDPNGIFINSMGGDYFYEGMNCDNDGKCKEFRLSTQMEREAEYIKTSD